MDQFNERNFKLYNVSQIVLNGGITHKLDFLATIYINDKFYFNVFRRYNSLFDIVIEDMYGELHYHKNYTVSQSLQNILCISDDKVRKLFTISSMSFKHNALIQADIQDLRWSEIQEKYYAIHVNFGGILNEYNNTYSETVNMVNNNELKQKEVKNEVVFHSVVDPNTLHNNLTISIPKDNCFVKSKSDCPSLSMRKSDIAGKKRRRPSYLYYSSCDEDEYEYEYEEDDYEESCEDDEVYSEQYKDNKSKYTKSNYTELRNGTLIPKRNN